MRADRKTANFNLSIRVILVHLIDIRKEFGKWANFSLKIDSNECKTVSAPNNKLARATIDFYGKGTVRATYRYFRRHFKPYNCICIQSFKQP